ncbi:MAG: holo-ACP synthase [Ignavibacteriales bacterium]|nr:holo-ACP synthase [Ignavibacteriales bacterium]
MKSRMIAGIGVDIVDVERMKTAIEAWEETFLKKMFTESEIAYCSSKKSPHIHYAARFAAKEAVAKAMHTGWSGTFRWRDVEVVNQPSGEPRVVLHGKVASALAGSLVHLSLSHTETTVVAFAVIEKM